MILGLDRAGDLPGAMAPEIWFDFLRSGGDFAPRENAGKSGTPDGKADRAGQRALLGICDHNLRDIFGLASLFCAFAAIAASPLEAPARFRCDAWQLALCWRGRASKRPARHTGSGTSGTENAGREKTAALLLERAAGTCPRACFRLALDLRACLRREEARARLLELRAWPGLPENGRQGCPPRVKALALRALSIDAEKNLGLDQALAYTAEALALFSPDHGESGFPRAPALPARLKEDLEKRKKRLLNRLETGVSEPVSKLQF
jgi:hypothetical protein